MAEIYTNLARSQLAAAITSTDTSLTLLTGDGNDLFPSPTGGDFFKLILFKRATGDIEIVTCSARTGDICSSLTRAYEGIGNGAAVPFDFDAGDYVECRPTASFFNSLGAPTTVSIQQQDYNYAVDSGAANQYIIDLTPAVASHASPGFFMFLPANTNTAASTFKPDTSLAVKNLKRLDGTDLLAGDIVANKVAVVVYDTTGDDYKLLNPRIPLSTADFASIASKNTFTNTQVWKQGTAMTGTAIVGGLLTFPDDGNSYTLNSTSTITAIATVGVGAVIWVRFLAAQQITDDADDIVIPGGTITTAAGDEAIFHEHQIGKWRIISYTRANGAQTGNALPAGATATTQTATDSSTKVATTAFVHAVIKGYTSAEQTFSTTSAALTHSLGGKPNIVNVWAVCKSAEGGYSTGDEVPLNTGVNDEDQGSGAQTHGISITRTATTIVWRLTSLTGITYPTKSTGTTFQMTSANWKLVFEALRIVQ